MDNALMLGLQTQRVLQRRLDVVANNLANMDTSGFKADDLVTEEFDDTTASADEKIAMALWRAIIFWS